MIRKLFLAAATAALGVTYGQGASAADLSLKAPPPAPVFSWTGLYIGVHGGGGWGTTETSVDVGGLLAGLGVPGVGFTLPLTSHTINGFLAGGTVGYNYQTGQWLLGVEGDFSWTDLKGTSDCLVILACKTEVNWMADFTGRLGFIPMDRVLVYAKGGVAFADVDYTFGNSLSVTSGGNTFAASITASQNDTRVGGLFGFGAEYAFLPGWSAKIEYNFMDFGTEHYNVPVTAAASLNGHSESITVNTPVDVNQFIHTMKIGVNYKFW